MKQDYLTPFLKHLSLNLPANLAESSEMEPILSASDLRKGVKHVSLQMPGSLEPMLSNAPLDTNDNNSHTGGAIPGKTLGRLASAIYNTPKSFGKKFMETTPERLAVMITDAIKSGLTQSNKSQTKEKDSSQPKEKDISQPKEKANSVQADINRIKRITMANGIDLYYGGGLLVFGPNFKIEKMIHMFYDTQKPMYFSTPVNDTMADNVLNTNIANAKPFSSADITQEIKTVINQTI